MDEHGVAERLGLERTFRSISFPPPCHGQRHLPRARAASSASSPASAEPAGLIAAAGALGSGAPCPGVPAMPPERARQKVAPRRPRRATHPGGSGRRSRGCPSSSRWARLGPPARPGAARRGSAVPEDARRAGQGGGRGAAPRPGPAPPARALPRPRPRSAPGSCPQRARAPRAARRPPRHARPGGRSRDGRRALCLGIS